LLPAILEQIEQPLLDESAEPPMPLQPIVMNLRKGSADCHSGISFHTDCAAPNARSDTRFHRVLHRIRAFPAGDSIALHLHLEADLDSPGSAAVLSGADSPTPSFVRTARACTWRS
jgi:hypothetical protein